MVKVNQKQILEAFNYRDRLEGGPRLELSAAEVAKILTEYILEDDSITRQAADHRLSSMADDPESPIVATNHGRSKTYMKREDITILADGGSPPDGGPADAEWLKVVSWSAQGLIEDEDILPTLKILRGVKGTRQGFSYALRSVFYMIAALTAGAAFAGWAGHAQIGDSLFDGATVLVLIAAPALWFAKRKADMIFQWFDGRESRLAEYWVAIGCESQEEEERELLSAEELPI